MCANCDTLTSCACTNTDCACFGLSNPSYCYLCGHSPKPCPSESAPDADPSSQSDSNS